MTAHVTVERLDDRLIRVGVEGHDDDHDCIWTRDKDGVCTLVDGAWATLSRHDAMRLAYQLLRVADTAVGEDVLHHIRTEWGLDPAVVR